MCGVLGLIYERERRDLGSTAAELLRALEYRGYDSTGAAIQGEGEDVVLLKGVGAPSAMVHELGIVSRSGQIFCGQVRWATFGAVDEANAQPHVVRCHVHCYGAHNGNVTNCDDLKASLTADRHTVLSDNDGEMVVHTIEHEFARELSLLTTAQRGDDNARRAAMRRAVVAGAARLKGSYAAVIVDPVSRCMWSIKQGSSLYFGVGSDAEGVAFTLSSSDLTAVLKKTRRLVPLYQGEFVEHDAREFRVYAAVDQGQVRAGEPIERAAVRSRLRAEDTGLLPGYDTYMAQEIDAAPATCAEVVELFTGGSAALRELAPRLAGVPAAELSPIAEGAERLGQCQDDDELRARFHELADTQVVRGLLRHVPGAVSSAAEVAAALTSAESSLLTDLLRLTRGGDDLRAVRLVDLLIERRDVEAFTAAVGRFVELCSASRARGGRLLAVCCGSSYHAALTAALFFNETAGTDLVPLLPGEFRARYARSLVGGDVIIAVSQSGETKDLIDVMNDVAATGRDVARITLVNNANSTMALEKSDLVIPLRCGPEIAVPATKSVMNQMAMLYGLALRLGERRLALLPAGDPRRETMAAELRERAARFERLPTLLRAALDGTADAVERAADMLYLAPSLHILGTRLSGVAMEGALKIREVVLNHCQGYEASEFKHGPNTILGFNTVLGPLHVDALLREAGAAIDGLFAEAAAGGDISEARRRVQALTSSLGASTEAAPAEQLFARPGALAALSADYPLVYVTGPDARDVGLTVSQIHTHKIRGAMSIVIAEEHPDLHQAASKPPAGKPGYRSAYIPLPRTGDVAMTAFTATAVMQRLALAMSSRKGRYLDRLGIPQHGVHPDSPKNVSKSITVD